MQKKLSAKQLQILVLVVLVGIALILRTPLFSTVPASPYWEETILGVDANALAQTGKDHHGTAWPILALESFGDWKPAGYVYAVVPFVKVFGLELWVIRLPSLLAGLAIVGAVAVLGKRLGVPWWAGALIVAVAPWAIHFSRAAWEAHLAIALIAWAVIFALNSFQPKKIAIIPALASTLFFTAAWYTYHSARIVVPLLGLGVLVYLFSTLTESARGSRESSLHSIQNYLKRSWLTVVLCCAVLVLGTMPIWLSGDTNALTHRLIYHRYVLWSSELMTAYLDHFSPTFLFLTGEENIRHTTGFFGLFYPFEVIFLLVGIYVWLQQRKPLQLLLLYWLGISIIPAALATPTPHALRILIGLPVFALLIAQGFVQTLSWLSRSIALHAPTQNLKKIAYQLALFSLLSLYVVGLSIFWFNYTQIYAQTSAREWQFGYKQMLTQLATFEATVPDVPVYISRFDGRPASFLWFYRQTDPREIQAENGTASKDQAEFLSFKKYRFVRSVGDIPSEPALIVVSGEEFEQFKSTHEIKELARISTFDGKTIWVIGQQ